MTILILKIDNKWIWQNDAMGTTCQQRFGKNNNNKTKHTWYVWVFKFSIASIFCTQWHNHNVAGTINLHFYVYLLPKPIKPSKKTGNVIMFTLKNWLCYFLFLLFSLYQVLTSVYPDILTVVNISVQKL